MLDHKAAPEAASINGNKTEYDYEYESNASTTGQEVSVTSEDDEMKEIRRATGRDTLSVNVWKAIVLAALVATGVAVTWSTHYFLQDAQTEGFEKQFSQFARTVADAALDQQKEALLATRGFADSISASAQTANATWPFYLMPRFEAYSMNYIKQSNAEVMAMLTFVTREEKDEWFKFINASYEELYQEAHMIRYGNLDRLNPIGYKNFFFSLGPGGPSPDIDRDSYFSVNHYSPPPSNYGVINWNTDSDAVYNPLIDNLLEMRTEILTSRVKPYAAAGVALTDAEHAAMHDRVFLDDSDFQNPHSFMFTPIYEEVRNPDSKIVALIATPFAWDFFMTSLLPDGVEGIVVVLDNGHCGQTYTYEINGPNVRYRGEGDLHDRKYDNMEVYQDLTKGFHENDLFYELDDHCRFSVRIYPAAKFEDELDPPLPEIFAIVFAAAFVLVIIIFFVYDLFVYRRNENLLTNAAESNAIVSSLFPRNMRDRLINTQEGSGTLKRGTSTNLKNFMVGDGSSGDEKRPLADLFMECTVLFADISGFTAWSSMREPSQVFLFLETIYSAFDHVAKLRRVFKVETVGDCYVAATGIPEFRKDHAVMMVKFAKDMLLKMRDLTEELETTLGPDTGDLSLRIGIHSGPVTAGVLRGERARFQLFGDTMNVCSRIESSGMAGRIHTSAETAECLKNNGKGYWLVRRDDTVTAKGKGEIQTYWIGGSFERELRQRGSSGGGASSRSHEKENANAVYEPVDHDNGSQGHDARMLRLVDWNVEMLSQILKQIVARRNAITNGQHAKAEARKSRSRTKQKTEGETFNPLDEVEEIIELPEFNARAASLQEDPESIVLQESVLEQLRHYVVTISAMYRDNPFHNFEHASHVTMSVIKLLARIVAPQELLDDNNVSGDDLGEDLEHTLHDHTYGITSDPLTQFSCAFAAMIHDVDHVGVPNAQLVKEGTRLAKIYNSRSVAEQNSLVLSWELLMMEEYDSLRSTLCANKAELERFRQLVVNTVMATDIVDKDLKALRNGRWDKAFKQTESSDDERAAVNRKATIVIEHLIQASDVAHTMQHWHVYRKWNEKFFRECYRAFKDGRAENDPTNGWYKGEIGFFDFYIIPLAKKLKECGVFGKSSDEYLNYAVANRNEWEKRGEDVVAEMIAAIKQEAAEEEGKIEAPNGGVNA